MSFNWNVNGLFRDRDKSSLLSQYAPITGLARSSIYQCADYHGNPYDCEGGADGVTTASINLLATGYDVTADYYHVSVHIDGPTTISPGGCHEQTGPGDAAPCGAVGGDYPVYDGTLSPGDWARIVIDQTGPPPWHSSSQQAVPDTFNATGTAGTNWRALTDWPDPTDVPGEGRGHNSYLVNPSPSWPVPDASGNTFGNCLFTAAELPSDIGLELIHHNREEEQPGRLWAFVQAYTLIEPDPPAGAGQRGCIVGCA